MKKLPLLTFVVLGVCIISESATFASKKTDTIVKAMRAERIKGTAPTIEDAKALDTSHCTLFRAELEEEESLQTKKTERLGTFELKFNLSYPGLFTASVDQPENEKVKNFLWEKRVYLENDGNNISGSIDSNKILITKVAKSEDFIFLIEKKGTNSFGIAACSNREFDGSSSEDDVDTDKINTEIDTDVDTHEINTEVDTKDK